MRAIEIARKFAALGSVKEACDAYIVAVHENADADPADEMEAAMYIFQAGGDYQIPYTCFRNLYNRGFCREDCLGIMTEAFYEPNIKALKARYAKNCKLLEKYPYMFRKDFLPFEDLPIRFYPFDDCGYLPFYPDEERFGDYVNFNHPVISRNFFKDLDKPILARNGFSQYELEYLNDNVRKSEHVAKENHIYLHYTDWAQFCAYLQCLNLRSLLKNKKFVFLVGDEIAQYPIDFKKRFGIDYSACSLKPIEVKDVSRLIWHTQLSAHNGGDMFNEVFDAHPNLIASTSLLMDGVERVIAEIRSILKECRTVNEAVQRFPVWEPQIITELYLMKNPTDKDILVGMLLRDIRNGERKNGPLLDSSSRIVPAIFFQPHFGNMLFNLHPDKSGHTTLHSEQYDTICNSPIFRDFKYIKTFTPMRRMTTSYGGSVRFMYAQELERKEKLLGDPISQRVLNRSYMVDWQNRLFKDSILVRFEDAKLNPKATFTALAAFLDIPYSESMTYGSEFGKKIDYASHWRAYKDVFDPSSVYRNYDEFANDSERYYIEYFLRDAYEYYGYDFQYYDSAPVDIKRVEELVSNFSKLDYYTRDIFIRNKRLDGDLEKTLTPEARQKMIEELADTSLEKDRMRRINNAKVLMRGLYFVNKNGQPLHMMPMLKLDPELLEQPLYR